MEPSQEPTQETVMFRLVPVVLTNRTYRTVTELTRVGLQQDLRLSQDLLGPVLGAVPPGDQVVQVGIQLGLLGLAQFLLCELTDKCLFQTCFIKFTENTEIENKNLWCCLKR